MANGSENEEFKPDRPIEVTDQMVAEARYFLCDWLGEGRAERTTIKEAADVAVLGILLAAMGDAIRVDRFREEAQILREIYGIESRAE